MVRLPTPGGPPVVRREAAPGVPGMARGREQAAPGPSSCGQAGLTMLTTRSPSAVRLVTVAFTPCPATHTLFHGLASFQ